MEKTRGFNGETRHQPRVFIVGGGFGGLEAARSLADAPVEVVLLDQRNHHVFQPLLYQVATAALSPADIAYPIRSIVKHQKNCRVVLAEVKGIDPARRLVLFERVAAEYDFLILAAGATHSYFGHEEWASRAPGLKSLEDATEIRRRILLAFENAEYEASPEERRAALTFAIVGGGATGVELAGAIKEIAAQTVPADFRNIDTTTTRVILLQGDDRLLPTFPADLSERAKRDLEDLGVEVRLKALVTDVSEDGVRVGDEFIPVRTVFWAAGVRGNPLAKSLGAPLDRAGRVLVNPDLSVPGFPEILVVGDMAAAKSADTGKPIPGVAQAALQMGRYAADRVKSEIMPGLERPGPFSYRDKGLLATIGRAKAVALIKGVKFTGIVAWLMWAFVHIVFLIGFRNRFIVMANWIWNWVVFARGARLITGEARLQIVKPLPQVIVREGPDGSLFAEPLLTDGHDEKGEERRDSARAH